MNPRYRSFSGALIAVFAVPVFLGLTACLPSFPVPVGNPEKSRIDPYVSGLWLVPEEETLYVFQPYDKRTWVLNGLSIRGDDEYCGEKFAAALDEALEEHADADEPDVELSEYDEFIAEMQHFGADCYEGEYEIAAIKVWRTKLGGEWFMTWEPLGGFDAAEGFAPEEWIVFRLITSVPNELRLQWLDTSHPAWDPLEDLDDEDVTTRAVEKVIRKNADDESFYHEDDVMVFQRVRPEHLKLFEDLLESNW